MSDEPATDVQDEAPAIDFSDQKEFSLASRGLRLVLKRSANELVQRDLDKFMARFTAQKQGNSTVEDNGKTLRAALQADWVEALVTPARVIKSGNDVDEMRPADVRWAAQMIDRVYARCREVPNA